MVGVGLCVHLRQLKTDLTVRLSFAIVAQDCPVFHVNQVPTRTGIFGTATVTIGIRAGVYHVAFYCLTPFINPNLLILVRVNVSVGGEEGAHIVLLDPFLRLVRDESKLPLILASAEIGAFRWVRVGIVAACGKRCVRGE